MGSTKTRLSLIHQKLQQIFDRIKVDSAQVSQRAARAIPAANPALYAAALEGGYKPNAYLTDYHDPYGSLSQTSHGGNTWEGGSLARFGLGTRDGDLTHTMHPHIRLMASLEHSHLALSTQCGIPLG